MVYGVEISLEGYREDERILMTSMLVIITMRVWNQLSLVAERFLEAMEEKRSGEKQ